jgi:mycothione reductase
VRHFDLVIIGSGSGNSLPDKRFSHLQVALVEESAIFGGTCLNVGCIPTKMFVYAANIAHWASDSTRYGVDASVDKVRWADIRDRVFGRIDPIAAGGRRYRAHGEPNITLISGHAEFSGPKSLTVSLTGGGHEEISADRIVIATGSRATVPGPIASSRVPFYTSDTVMRIDELPERMVILGGGYIASEFAHVFSALGTEVTLVTRGPALLRHMDESLSARFTEIARKHWNVHTGAVPVDAMHSGDQILVELSDGGEVRGDLLLVATGRIPNSDRLNLAAAGVPVHADGRVVVDEFQRTPVEGIHALGDVSSPYQLKHVANHEATVVAHNLANPDSPRRTDHRFVPSAVFTEPEIASVGLTEAQCRARLELGGSRFVGTIQDYGSVAYGWAMEDTTGFCKLLADPATGRLLGAHLLGPQASTVIQPLIQAMSFGLSVREMALGQYWIHPALPEIVENALLSLELD